MMQELFELARAIAIGVAIGGVLVGLRLLKRWARGEPLLPKVQHEPVPLKVWIFGTAFFGGMAAMALWTGSPVFAAAFGAIASLYAIGWIRFIATRPRSA